MVIIKVMNREVTRQVHPNYSDDDSDSDDYNDIEGQEIDINKGLVKVSPEESDDKTLIGEIALNKDKLDEFLIIIRKFQENSPFPEFILDLEQVKVAKFGTELLRNLNLDLEYERKFLKDIVHIEFDDSISYVTEEKFKFSKLVLDKPSVLADESNYFIVRDNNISPGTEVMCLVNVRCFLATRDISLSEFTKKRILTLGLNFLLEGASQAELLFEIQKLVPSGLFDIKITFEPLTYVLIVIEKPIFSF